MIALCKKLLTMYRCSAFPGQNEKTFPATYPMCHKIDLHSMSCHYLFSISFSLKDFLNAVSSLYSDILKTRYMSILNTGIVLKPLHWSSTKSSEFLTPTQSHGKAYQYLNSIAHYSQCLTLNGESD